MKLAYTHENRFLVANAHNILEQHGITTVWKNEYASSAIGEVASLDTWPELWVVDDADYDQAVHIISTALSAKNAPEWVCSNCDEKNDAAFELCWNCQSEPETVEVKQ
jgi:hypothetical protein